MTLPVGFEPTASRLTVERSNQLSYGTLKIDYSRRGSNPRPLLHKSSALPTELREQSENILTDFFE